MTTELIILLLITFMFSALLKGWSGFGTNLIAMPILATTSIYGYLPNEAVTIVITVNLFMNIAILLENKKFNLEALKSIWILVIFGVLFTGVGVLFLKDPDNAKIVKIFAGVIITITAFYRIYVTKVGQKPVFHEETMSKYYIPVGIISGLFNGIAGLGGLPVLVLLSNSDMERNKFRTTLVSYFLVMNLVAMIGYVVAGNYSSFVFLNIGIAIIPALVFCMIGVYLSRRVSHKSFTKVMNFILVYFGLNLIINGIYGINILNYLIDMI